LSGVSLLWYDEATNKAIGEVRALTGKGKKIVLVGFMGTGKSTVSRLLSERLGRRRIDLDDEIERSEGRLIADIFTEVGESGFRAVESRVLESIMRTPEAAVVSTGGGAVLAEANRMTMQTFGWVVALTAAAEQIIARVSSDASRPLLAGDVQGRVRTLLEQRKDAYDFADLTVDTTRLTPSQTAEQILLAWDRLTR
jgi:shikimate kinase